MLRSTKPLKGYRVEATDGTFGTVTDFLFDEDQWTLRWMVADTGTWLPGSKVLISPVSLGVPDWSARIFPVRLAKNEIENAPSLQTDEPVSRKYEREFFDHYGWPYYWSDAGVWGGGGFAGGANVWGAAGVWGGAPTPGALSTRQEKNEPPPGSGEAERYALRSTEEVVGYRIQALDDEIGHVEDFIVDDETWILRYMVVDTRNWLPGRKVLIAPAWVDAMEWADQKVQVELTRDAVKNSPEYHPSEPVNREYEEQLYDYYGRPMYP